MGKRIKPVPVTIVHDSPSVAEPYRPKDSMHMSIRQIDNGYIVNTHGYKGGQHFDRDVYTPTAPKINVPGARTRVRAEPPAAPPPSAPATPSRTRGTTAPPREQKDGSFMTVDMAPAKGKVKTKDKLNVPSDAPLPQLKRSARDQRLRSAKL